MSETEIADTEAEGERGTGFTATATAAAEGELFAGTECGRALCVVDLCEGEREIPRDSDPEAEPEDECESASAEEEESDPEKVGCLGSVTETEAEAEAAERCLSVEREALVALGPSPPNRPPRPAPGVPLARIL
jgi:hypothetical protein